MRVLLFDTETSGLPSWRMPYGHPTQPDVVQLAMLLVDTDTDEEICSISVIVKDGKPCEEGAAAVHGITQDKIDRFGIPQRLAASMFHWMTAQADLVVAHNIDFDIGMMKTTFIRQGINPPLLKTFCTMKVLTDICKIPHANPNRGKSASYKWPKLIEAYKLLIDEEGFDGAHDAMVDVRACYELFKWLGKNGYVPGYSGYAENEVREGEVLPPEVAVA